MQSFLVVLKTFLDNSTRYTWIYILKKEDEVFMNEKFRKLKALHSDNGDKYESTEFNDYLQSSLVYSSKNT